MNDAKHFSQSFIDLILQKVEALQAATPGPHYAAFDADGTLWDNDVGENFFQFQIDHCNLKGLKNLDPWSHYEALKKKHPPDAYLWLAQLCADHSLDEVRAWSKKAVELSPPNVFPSQQQLIHALLKRNIQIYVVSASVHWAVEGALSAVGLRPENALGVKTKIVNDLVTMDADGPVTWREGKRKALLEKTHGVLPLLCSGNTSGDIHLLECSQGVALAVQSQTVNTKHKKLYDDEQVLFDLSKKNGWLTHAFK